MSHACPCLPRALGEEKPAVACACYIDNDALSSRCYCDVSLHGVSQTQTQSVHGLNSVKTSPRYPNVVLRKSVCNWFLRR
jgi:ferredoxin-thioredoxin reductase catalytic subunit